MHDDDAALAAWAQAFEQKLAQPAHFMDPDQLRAPDAPWAWIEQLPDQAARGRLAARLFVREVAPLPDLQRLLDRHARVALLDREQLLSQLCRLALMRRPGALRCCIDSQARAALQNMLGVGFEPLMEASMSGRAVPEHLARWTPMHWSCLGYFDWAGLLRTADHALRRLVRLSLPRSLLGVRSGGRMSAQVPALGAIARMDELGLGWSC